MSGLRLVPKHAVLAGLVLVALALAPGVAHAAFPGANGRIVFSRCEDGVSTCDNFQVWVMNPDGTGQARLAPDAPGFFQEDPAFSADGRVVALQRCIPDSPVSYKCAIAVVDAHGQGLKQLTPLDSVPGDDYPAFSPDGSLIVFNRDGDIWMMGSDGSNPHALTSGSEFDQHPVFSPDGTKIVFARDNVLTVMSSTPPYTPAAIPGGSTSEESPDFAPDGSGLVYTDCTTTCHAMFTKLDGAGRHDLTTPTGGNSDNEGAFSPDGKLLVFEEHGSAIDAPIHLFGANLAAAGSPFQLTTTDDYKADWGRVPTPSVDSPPTISGFARVGHVLTATPGAANWGGATSLQWLLCNRVGGACTPIAGATGNTYKPTSSAAKHTLRVRQTQSDAGGSASADSAPSPSLAGEPGAKLTRTAHVKKGIATLKMSCPAVQSGFCRGSVELSVFEQVRSTKRVKLKLGSRKFKIKAGKHAKVKVKLGRQVKISLTLKGKIRVNATVKSSDDAGNKTTTKTKVLLLSRHRAA